MSTPDPRPTVTCEIQIQPGPDGTPWEALHFSHGVMGVTIVAPPGATMALAETLPDLLNRAVTNAIAAGMDADMTALDNAAMLDHDSTTNTD